MMHPPKEKGTAKGRDDSQGVREDDRRDRQNGHEGLEVCCWIERWPWFGRLKNLAERLIERMRCFDWPAGCFDPEVAAGFRISVAPFNSS